MCDGQKELIKALRKYSFKNLCRTNLKSNLERIIKKPADEIVVDFKDINKRRLLKYSYDNFLRKYKDLFK